MEIPILNIYYLLCYAWNKLDEGNKVQVESSDYNEAIDLFARVLINGSNRLFKRGLDRSYIEVSEEYPGIKGRIDFSASLNKNLFRQGKAICSFDQFDYNVLQNQIIKATLHRLARVKTLEKKLKTEVWDCYWKFGEVDDIELQLHSFGKVRIHRNNSFYDFLLRICRLIIESTVLDEKDGKFHFKEFLGSDKAMAAMFEAFVRNFYKKEQSEYRVGSPKIHWKAHSLDGSNLRISL